MKWFNNYRYSIEDSPDACVGLKALIYFNKMFPQRDYFCLLPGLRVFDIIY